MRRTMLLIGLLAASAPPALAAPGKLEIEVRKLVAGLTPDTCGVALPSLVKAAEDKGFMALPVDFRAEALMSVLETCRPATAISGPLAAQLEPIAQAPGQAQLASFYLIVRDVAAKDDNKAADRFVGLEQTAPEVIDRFSRPYLSQIANIAQKDPARRKAVLKVLATHAWPTNSWSNSTKAEYGRSVWAVAYASALLKDGDVAGAKAAVGPLPEPEMIRAMSQDPKFKPVLAELEAEGQLDLAASAKAALARRNALAETYPQYLEPHVNAMSYLVTLDQAEQAVARGNAILARVEAGEDFLDISTQHAWLLDYLADAYQALGREEEALAVQKRAVDSPYSNVSQVLNLAASQLELGRMQDALATLDKGEAMPASPYGRMVMSRVAACAAITLDPPRARKGLEYLRAHWQDSPDHLVKGLVCHGRTEEAAKAFLADLRAGKSPEL